MFLVLGGFSNLSLLPNVGSISINIYIGKTMYTPTVGCKTPYMTTKYTLFSELFKSSTAVLIWGLINLKGTASNIAHRDGGVHRLSF